MLLVNLTLSALGLVRLVHVRRVGLHGRIFNEYTYQGGFMPHLPVLFSVLRGHLSLVGPRAVV